MSPKSTPLPLHPGRVLELEFMDPLNLKAYTLSKLLDVPRSTIESVVRGRRPISAPLALRLSRLFSNSPAFWTNLQSHYELELAKDEIGDDIMAIEPYASV